jgi:hypothetical protein
VDPREPTAEDVAEILRRSEARRRRPPWSPPPGAGNRRVRDTSFGRVLPLLLLPPAMLWARSGLAAPRAGVLYALLLGPSAVWGGLWFLARWWRGRRLRRHSRSIAKSVESATLSWEADWTLPRDVVAPRPLLARVLPRGYAWGFKLVVWICTCVLLTGWSGFVGAALLAAPVALALVIAGWLVARGAPQIRFAPFPAFVGTRVRLYVAMSAGSARLEDAAALLRCVEGTGLGVPGWIDWHAVSEVRPDACPGPDEFVEVAFDVPAGAPGTRLHADRPVWWELVVAGRTRWGPVVETFVVPVYAAPPTQGTSGAVAASEGSA